MPRSEVTFSPNPQAKYARGESAIQAKENQSAPQAPAEYYFTDDLFDKHPPLPEMNFDKDDFAELRSQLLGQKIGGRLPNKEQLKEYDCIEQYLLYNSYALF